MKVGKTTTDIQNINLLAKSMIFQKAKSVDNKEIFQTEESSVGEIMLQIMTITGPFPQKERFKTLDQFLKEINCYNLSE